MLCSRATIHRSYILNASNIRHIYMYVRKTVYWSVNTFELIII